MIGSGAGSPPPRELLGIVSAFPGKHPKAVDFWKARFGTYDSDVSCQFYTARRR
jgi:hypothetical protein